MRRCRSACVERQPGGRQRAQVGGGLSSVMPSTDEVVYVVHLEVSASNGTWTVRAPASDLAIFSID